VTDTMKSNMKSPWATDWHDDHLTLADLEPNHALYGKLLFR